MHRPNEKTMALFLRIKRSQDGPELIDYLERLSYENYCAFKEDDADMNEIHKGFALCVDSLIENFTECGKGHQVMTGASSPDEEEGAD